MAYGFKGSKAAGGKNEGEEEREAEEEEEGCAAGSSKGRLRPPPLPTRAAEALYALACVLLVGCALVAPGWPLFRFCVRWAQEWGMWRVLPLLPAMYLAWGCMLCGTALLGRWLLLPPLDPACPIPMW